MSRFVLVVVALAIGFSLGWLAHRPADRSPANPARIEANAPAPVAASAAPKVASAPATLAPDRRNERRARLDTMKWLRESGAPVQLRVFHDTGLDESLIKVLGLNETEKARLTEAAQSAQHQIDAVRATTARTWRSPDGTSLIVDLPALDATSSGAIYDRFLETLQATLGSERTEIFHEVAGEALERSFDRFGLNAVRYEVTPPRSLDGTAFLFVDYKRHIIDATGSFAMSTSSRSLAGEVAKHDRLLAKILPPGFETGTARP